jgi:asparagine synthase (glutamine-hydrolysing)
LKYRGGEGKYLLKRLLSRYVPERLFDRPKKGFSVPLERWLRVELKEMVSDYLSESRLKSEGLFNCDIVGAHLKDHFSGKADHHHRLWALLMWEMWREKWLG